MSKSGRVLLIVSLVFFGTSLVTALVLAVLIGDSPPITANIVKSDPVPPSDPVQKEELAPVSWRLKANDLFFFYQTNSVDARSRFEGKTVEIKGVIRSVSEDRKHLWVDLYSDDWDFPWGVRCHFGQEERESLAPLQPHHSVTIRGRCEGCNLHVLLSRCQIVK